MTDFRRQVDPTFRRKTNKDVLELNNLKSQYNQCKADVDRCRERLSYENSSLQNVRALYEDANNRLSDAQVEIDCDPLPEGAQPRPRIHKRDQLSLEVDQLNAALDAQRKSTAHASEQFMESERKLFEADRDLNRFAENLEDTILAIATIKELDNDKAARLAKLESDTASRKEKEKRLAQEAKEAQEREMNELKKIRAEAARKLNIVAKGKVAQTTAKTRDITSQMREMNETVLQDRAEAVLELKTNVAAVNAKLATQADRYRWKVADAAQRLEDEKEALLSKGLNPYVEFRRKELDQEAAAREKRMLESVERNKAELAARIEKEQRLEAKQIQAQRVARDYERKHRESQGRHVVEEKNREYIVSRTADGREVLDPTGRVARVDPSQITDIPDYSFGLGKSARIPADSMKRITGQIRESLRVESSDLGEYERLAAGLAKRTVVDDGEGDEGEDDFAPSATRSNKGELDHLSALAAAGGIMPGTDKAALTVNLRGDEVEKQALLKIAVEEEGKGAGSGPAQLHSLQSPKYKLADLSKFERDALDRAKNRHRDRIEGGVPQVAGGKVFPGPASFVPKPLEGLLYKDFEVGRRYRKVFTLTNVSYTFNSFKALALPDDVTDFFVVAFDKPGRMSAGMSCAIEVTFAPQVNQDIDTFLSFHTETGPVYVPLRCLIKRCAPKVLTPELDFGPVVMGQILTQQLRVTNTQALGTSFSIHPVAEEAPQGEVQEGVDGPEGDVGDIGPVRRQSSARLLTDLQIPPLEDSDDGAKINGLAEGDVVGAEPAINAAELDARVQRVMTEVLRRKQSENPFPLSCNVSESHVDGYGTVSLQVTCAPLTVGALERTFRLVFDGVEDGSGTVDAQGEPVTREQFVVARTVGEEVPIYVAEETLDLRCTLHGRIYRNKVVLKNRGRSAYRVIVKVSRAFSPFVEVSPTMFFVQARSSQSMNVKFTPSAEMLASLAHFSLPYEGFEGAALMCLPVEVQVVNQELPLYFAIRSSVTSSTIRLSASTLDFGRIYVGQQSTLRLTLTNTSMLPQKTAFVRMRREFAVQPNDGFAVLLPNESIEVEVAFSPQSTVNYTLDLSLLTSFNDTYVVKVLAEGVEPPLSFSSAVVQMRTTGPGERVLESTTVTNTTRYAQSFEVALPDRRFSWLSVSPTVVHLAAGQSCRLEIEFSPPENAMQLDPEEWHADLLASGEGNGEAAGNSSGSSPFEEWSADSGWVFGKGLFGGVQWTKAGARAPSQGEDETEAHGSEGGVADGQAVSPDEDDLSGLVVSEGATAAGRFDLPPEEWGVLGKWNLPVMLKPRKRTQGDFPSSPDFAATASPLSPGRRSGKSNVPPSPLFLSVHTVVVPPQLEADAKLLDFGQISVGTRQIRTFRVFNRGYDPIKLRTAGLNAVGPFTLLRPIREIQPGESRVVIVECLPVLPGLVAEVLEISAEDPSVGGHRLRISMRVQGLKPSIDLEGLAPPPANWNPRSGILDFGNVLAADYVTKTFVIRNKSTFAVDARIVRVAGLGLPPLAQGELVERTAAGIPVISIRPERVQIAQGASEEVEVTFRPDRGRLQPFREDLDVMIGQTDEVLRVGVIGRCWARQVFVVPENPSDEAISKTFLFDPASVEDLPSVSTNAATRAAVADAQKELKLSLPAAPELTLEFPDPFASSADPSSYIEIDSAPLAGGKAPAAAKGAPVVAAAPGSRKQTKRLLVSSAKVMDGRPGVTAGTFEVVLGAEARSSGIWSLGVDKGSIPAGGPDVPLDVVCTQAKPRSLGGICVGSWRSFSAEVVVKGGWCAPGEPEENRIPLVLRAFVCL